MQKLNQVLLRILAAFAASGLGVIGAGTLAGVQLWKAMLMAGVAAVATVVERLARLYLEDGNLSAKDIDVAFGVKAKEETPAKLPVPAKKR